MNRCPSSIWIGCSSLLRRKPWAFATERRAEIDAWFAARQRENPALWNGRVLLLHDHAMADGVFRGRYLETDFASFAAWRAWGRPAAAIHDCFGAAAIIGRRRRVPARRHGLAYRQCRPHLFSLRHAGSGRHRRGRVDLDFSVRRELKEETGLDVAEFTAEPGWTAVFDTSRIAHIKVLRSRDSAAALRRRVLDSSGARAAAGTRRHPHRAQPRRFRSGNAALRHRFPGAPVRHAIGVSAHEARTHRQALSHRQAGQIPLCPSTIPPSAAG